MENDPIAERNRILEAEVEILLKRVESLRFWLDINRGFVAHGEAELAVARRALRLACESLGSEKEDPEAMEQCFLEVARNEVAGRTSS